MHHPVLYLFYPRRNPSLSYTRQIQGLITFILFVLITIGAPDPSGALLVPSLGASIVVAVVTIFLGITSTDLSRTIEDQLEQALNLRLQRIAPHHARVIKNNLHRTDTQAIQLSLRDEVPPRVPPRRIHVDAYNHAPINQPELSADQPNLDRIHLNDAPGCRESRPIDYSYLNDVPYKHLKRDALAISRGLVMDPPVLIDPRMIIYKIWQRPGHYAVDKELLRWACYAIHIGVYLSPVWWALWPDLSWQTRLIPVATHSFILLVVVGAIISHDATICQRALKDGDIENYLHRLYDTNRRQPVIEHLPYNRSLYIMHLLNVMANHYKT
jgi:hypothetical protein